jgi:hypothetical protein
MSAYTSGRYTEIWSLIATASRLAVLAGLNHLGPLPQATPRPADPSDRRGVVDRRSTTEIVRKGLIGPPRDEEELRERQMTWWGVFVSDRMSCAGGGWAQTIDDRDITTSLPAFNGVAESVRPLSFVAFVGENPFKRS